MQHRYIRRVVATDTARPGDNVAQSTTLDDSQSHLGDVR